VEEDDRPENVGARQIYGGRRRRRRRVPPRRRRRPRHRRQTSLYSHFRSFAVQQGQFATFSSPPRPRPLCCVLPPPKRWHLLLLLPLVHVRRRRNGEEKARSLRSAPTFTARQPTGRPSRGPVCVFPGELRICTGCGGKIHDQFILRVAPDLEWHASCLRCRECQRCLDETHTCFVRDGKIFCRDDYLRWVAGAWRAESEALAQLAALIPADEIALRPRHYWISGREGKRERGQGKARQTRRGEGRRWRWRWRWR